MNPSRSPVLGRFPLPVEVIPMARSLVTRELQRIGASVTERAGFVTDNGNLILDAAGLRITDPLGLEAEINQWPGRGDGRAVCQAATRTCCWSRAPVRAWLERGRLIRSSGGT